MLQASPRVRARTRTGHEYASPPGLADRMHGSESDLLPHHHVLTDRARSPALHVQYASPPGLADERTFGLRLYPDSQTNDQMLENQSDLLARHQASIIRAQSPDHTKQAPPPANMKRRRKLGVSAKPRERRSCARARGVRAPALLAVRREGPKPCAAPGSSFRAAQPQSSSLTKGRRE